MNVKWVKIPSLAALQVPKYTRTVKSCAWAFKEKKLPWKKIIFYYFGRRFSCAQKWSPTWKTACIRPDTSFDSFPEDDTLKQKWIQNIKLVNLPNNPKIWHYHFESYCFKQDLHVNTYIFDLNHLTVIFLQVYFLFWSTAILHQNYKNFWRGILEAGYTIKMFSLLLEWASWKTTEEISQWRRCFCII